VNSTLDDLDILGDEGAISNSLAQNMAQMKGLATLAAKLDFKSAALHQALFRNTTLTKMFCDPLTEPLPDAVSKNLQRNKLIQKVPALIGQDKNAANRPLFASWEKDERHPTNWPHCVEQLAAAGRGSGVGLSAAYLFVSATLFELVELRNKTKNDKNEPIYTENNNAV
jgi:hypothetical protein